MYRRSRSNPIPVGRPDIDSLADEYITARDVFPIRIPLEKVDLGLVKYLASEEGSPFDIELLYEMETSDILIRTSIPSLNDKAGPGTFRLRGIEAAKLDLVNEIPGSLEGIMARLVLETKNNVEFQHDVLSKLQINGKNETIFNEIDRELNCHRIILTTSVHEAGHLRDILLFLKSKNLTGLPDDSLNPYYNPLRRQKLSSENDESTKPSLTFVEDLPWWSLYLPWRLYSRRIRKVMQLGFLLYSIFTIIWAAWQLYRHVNIIQMALQPLVEIFRLYLDDVMKVVDNFLDMFTHYWTSLLSPLNIFWGVLLLPIWNVIVQLKSFVMPVLSLLTRMIAPFSRCMAFLWQGVLNSRVAVQSLDISKIQRNFVLNIIFNCLKAAGLGLAKIVGYSRSKTLQKQAIMNQQSKIRGSISSPAVSFTSPRKRTSQSRPTLPIPVYYSSPLTKQSTD